jgi:hypothetical protein
MSLSGLLVANMITGKVIIEVVAFRATGFGWLS